MGDRGRSATATAPHRPAGAAGRRERLAPPLHISRRIVSFQSLGRRGTVRGRNRSRIGSRSPRRPPDRTDSRGRRADISDRDRQARWSDLGNSGDRRAGCRRAPRGKRPRGGAGRSSPDRPGTRRARRSRSGRSRRARSGTPAGSRPNRPRPGHRTRSSQPCRPQAADSLDRRDSEAPTPHRFPIPPPWSPPRRRWDLRPRLRGGPTPRPRTRRRLHPRGC